MRSDDKTIDIKNIYGVPPIGILEWAEQIMGKDIPYYQKQAIKMISLYEGKVAFKFARKKDGVALLRLLQEYNEYLRGRENGRYGDNATTKTDGSDIGEEKGSGTG